MNETHFSSSTRACHSFSSRFLQSTLQDSHCKDGLICYHRDKEGESVPGCSGHPDSSKLFHFLCDAVWPTCDTLIHTHLTNVYHIIYRNGLLRQGKV